MQGAVAKPRNHSKNQKRRSIHSKDGTMITSSAAHAGSAPALRSIPLGATTPRNSGFTVSEQNGSLAFAKSSAIGIDSSVKISDVNLSAATTKLTLSLDLKAGAFNFTAGQSYLKTLWSTNGTDTIDLSQLTNASTVDLNGGAYSASTSPVPPRAPFTLATRTSASPSAAKSTASRCPQPTVSRKASRSTRPTLTVRLTASTRSTPPTIKSISRNRSSVP